MQVRKTSVELYWQWRREVLGENPLKCHFVHQKNPTWNDLRPNTGLWMAVRLQIRKWTLVGYNKHTAGYAAVRRVRKDRINEQNSGSIGRSLRQAAGEICITFTALSEFAWRNSYKIKRHFQNKVFSKGTNVSTGHAVPTETSCSWFSVINVMAADQFYFVLTFKMCIICIVFAHSFFPLELLLQTNPNSAT
jgi:hypothetical protein